MDRKAVVKRSNRKKGGHIADKLKKAAEMHLNHACRLKQGGKYCKFS